MTSAPTEIRTPRRAGQPIRIPRILLHGGLALWGLLSLLPLIWMLSASLQTTSEIYGGVHLIPRSLNWSNYERAWQEASFSVFLGNSLIYTITVTIGTIAIGAAAAYAFARLRFPGKRVLYFVLLAFLFIPIPGAFIPLYVVLAKLHLLNTRIGYILPMINGNLPVALFILRSYFEQIPIALEEAGLIDGASRFQIFRKIALPLVRPAIATVAIFTILGTWNEYVLASVVFNDQSLMPLQVGLLSFQGSYFSQYALMMAATAITTLPIVLVYLSLQRHIIRGVMAGAVKG